MELVEQRGDSDCLIACLATILHVGYENIPANIGEEENQLNNMQKFLSTYGLVCWSFGIWGDKEPLLKFGNKKLEYHFHPPGFWIASVKSPRTGNGHTVVMRSSKIFFDPHPKRNMGHLGFEEALILMPEAEWE